MKRSFELFVGLRYTRAKRRNHFISFITLISMLGIALGVMVLIVVLSVMNGFEKELRVRILGMTAHATVSGQDGQLTDWQGVADVAKKHPKVIGIAPYIQGEAMLSTGQQVNGAMLRAVLPQEEPKVSDVGSKMLFGNLDVLKPGEYGIILGKDLARVLGVMRGDKITVIIPQTTVTPAGVLPRLKRFTVVGIFEAGMYEYDSTLALIHLEDARKLFSMPDRVSGLRLKLTDMFQSAVVVRELVETLPGDYWISDWTRQHANFFRAIKMEKTVMAIILALIVGVAAFNLVSTLVMTVVDKEADIAILRTLGATPRSILQIFIVQGTIIGVVGTALGTLSGTLIAANIGVIVPWIEHTFNVAFLAADVYYIAELPSDMHLKDIITVDVVSLVFSLVATLYPAYRASRVQPAEALRYE
ncbi:MAG: lipoprotein-releasing ABC transporter permease subunit [Gammaproteobacteria bacterium]|nr:lipoprotein-releasing ABC transporter permease subunit [Gammaproteobacteria bacterium]